MTAKTLMSALAALAAVTVFANPMWRDPKVNSQNRLPARAVAVPCDSQNLALAIAVGERPRTDSKWVETLNGEWDFKWKHTVDAKEWEKECKIRVPGCWQLQGDFDPALYTNVTYPIHGWNEGDPSVEPPKDYTSHYYRNPVGLYSRKISLPKGWKGRRVVLHFGGVSSAMYVRINGERVGYSEDSRLPAEFDITKFLKSGENLLEVEVLKHCDGSFLEDQDFWRLSGIFRDVWLVSEAEGSPWDLVAEATLSDDYRTGTLVVRDESGKELFKKTYENPKLWSCEAPNMYYVAVRVKKGGFFSSDDWRAVAFGFRKVEIKDAVVYINGKRALIKGVNRHEMEPTTGYTMTMEEMERDIAIFKRLNVNAVRTCHYPNDPTWYELCDRAGIMVCCEANVESHGAGFGKNALPKNPLYHDAIVERGVNMVKTFRNHPSIVFWSLGNESGDGPAMKDEYGAMKAIDSTRPVQYEGTCRDKKFETAKLDHTDIVCPMYWRVDKMEEWVKKDGGKPLIQCEYTHAMGNSNGDIQRFWDLARKYPSVQGGFIWDFQDQALWKKGDKGEALAYGGDYGDKPNQGNFNCNGIVAADRSLHPGAYEVKHAYQNVNVESWDWETKTARIRNDFRFTSLDGVRAMWKVEKSGEFVASGTVDVTGIGPESAKDVKIDAPDGDAITFAFGEEGAAEPFAHDQFAKPFPVAPSYPVPSAQDNQAPADPNTFRMNFWRAPIDNDNGWKMAKVCKAWKDATVAQKAPEGAEATLEAHAAGSGTKVSLALEVASTDLPPVPRVGVTFKIPRGYTKVKWYGMGPWENYCDRATAAMLGVWGAEVGVLSGYADGAGKLGVTGDALNPDNYVNPGEQGYRTGCRWIEFTDGNGKSVKVTALSAPVGFNAWPYSQATLENAKHQWDLTDEGEITVNVDAVQMGIGGDNSWGARPHGDDMVGKGEYGVSFIVEGL